MHIFHLHNASLGDKFEIARKPNSILVRITKIVMFRLNGTNGGDYFETPASLTPYFIEKREHYNIPIRKFN